MNIKNLTNRFKLIAKKIKCFALGHKSNEIIETDQLTKEPVSKCIYCECTLFEDLRRS